MKIHFSILVLLAARVLSAVDGQVRINQATVNIAGGFTYHITQPGSYKLTIQIDSSDVTLDLNRFGTGCLYLNNVGVF